MRKMPVRVDEHVDAAEALDGRIDQRLRVARPVIRPATISTRSPDGSSSSRAASSSARRVPLSTTCAPPSRNAPRRGLADAAATARDDDHLAREVHRDSLARDWCMCT